jgi:FAD/FMN-containing dehydrogenase
MVVHAADLPQFLPRLNAILQEYNLTYTIAGHVGNGNFHIIPLMNLADPAQRDIIFELSQRVYTLVFEFHGSITGEHNDGLIRTPYLQRQFGPLVYDLFRRTKTLFDPHNIFNPGKKIGATIDYAKAHIKLE